MLVQKDKQNPQALTLIENPDGQTKVKKLLEQFKTRHVYILGT